MYMTCHTVSDLIAEFNVLFGVNNDLLLAIDRDDFRRAIRVTRVVDEPSGTEADIVSNRYCTRITAHTRGCPSSWRPRQALHQSGIGNCSRYPDVHTLSRVYPRQRPE
jgi:hypothetical protein